MTSSVKIKFDVREKYIHSLEDVDVLVGIIGAAASVPYEKGSTVGEIALQNEIGAGVPRRSWLQDWVVANESEILKRLRTAVGSLQGYGVLGAWAAGQIQQRIANGIEPPNAPATIKAKKGKATPLIDTGIFRTSIAYKVNRKK